MVQKLLGKFEVAEILRITPAGIQLVQTLELDMT